MPKLLTIAVLVFSLAMVTGCGENKNEEPTTPFTSVANEETTFEVEESTEPTLAETTEPAETVPETEAVEEGNFVEKNRLQQVYGNVRLD